MCLFELPPVQGPVLALQVTAMQISYMSTPSYICTDVQLKMCVDSVGAGLIFVVVFCRMWVLLVHQYTTDAEGLAHQWWLELAHSEEQVGCIDAHRRNTSSLQSISFSFQQVVQHFEKRAEKQKVIPPLIGGYYQSTCQVTQCVSAV